MRTQPPPGSKDAVDQGCTCELLYDFEVSRAPYGHRIDPACRLHWTAALPVPTTAYIVPPSTPSGVYHDLAEVATLGDD